MPGLGGRSNRAISRDVTASSNVDSLSNEQHDNYYTHTATKITNSEISQLVVNGKVAADSNLNIYNHILETLN